jgi:hypothetical protein
MQLRTPTVSGKTYRVMYRISLISGDWSMLQQWVSDGNDFLFTATEPGFYRIEVQ